MYSFKETQRFRQWWLWLLLLFVVMVSIVAPIYKMQHYSGGVAFGPIAIQSVAVVLIIVLFRLLKLETRIDESGIHYRYPPFINKERKIGWEQLKDAFVRVYSPIGDYGGWGLRTGLGRGGAYNVSGNVGLQLIFKDGTQLLFGTRRGDELSALIERLKNDKVIHLPDAEAK